MLALLWLIVAAVLLGGGAHGAEKVLLYPPINSGGPETLLICIPGMFVPATEYLNPCLGVQKAIPFKTWLGVMSFRGDTVSPFAIQKGLDMALQLVRDQGFTNATDSDVIFWAHSAGGAFSTSIAAERGLGGMILMGSYLSGLPLATYPVPVMSLGGELDGLCQITKVAEDYRVCRDLLLEGKEEEAITRKPVIVIEGLNHAQMCSGYAEDPIGLADFPPEISQEQADQIIAELSAAFVQVVRQAGNPQGAYGLLRDHVERTNSLVGGFLLAQDQDQGEWCVRSQRIIANYNNESVLEVSNVQEPDIDAFAESKASLSVAGGVATIVTHSFLNITSSIPIRQAAGPQQVGILSEGQAAVEACCKCKSQEAIAAALKNPAHGVAGTCKDINMAIFGEALRAVAERSRLRYETVGRQLQFLDDIMQSRGDQWLASHLIFDLNTDPVQVIASRLTSGNIPTEFGGANYCKGVSAAKMVAWILHDSLPRGL